MGQKLVHAMSVYIKSHDLSKNGKKTDTVKQYVKRKTVYHMQFLFS